MPAMPDSPASLSRTARRRLWLAGGVALLGVALSMAAGLWISDQAQQRLETEFEQLSERLASQLQQRLAQPSDAMGGVRGTLAVNGDLTRLDLRAYVEARELGQAFPGVRGIGVVKRVLRDDIESFVQAERADGAADFKLSSLSDAAQRDLYVITQVEPAAGNDAVRGLDAGSDPARRWAFERAVTSGLPTMSAPLRLLQNQQQKPSVLIALPAYRPGTQPETPQQRIDALWGFFYAPVVLDELLHDFSAQLGDAVALQLEDLQAGSAQQGLLYRSPDVLGVGRTRRVIEFEQYGRPLRMSLQAGAAFEARFAQWPAGVVAGAGALLSYLAAAFLFQATRARELAEQHARSLTADLERMALVAQRTHNAVAICDAQRHIAWINEGFTRLTGFAAEEAQGRRPGELLAFELGDAKVNEQLRAALDAGEAFHGELVNRSRDGTAFWAAIEAQPLRDGEGGVSGFLLILSDISERKQAELALQDQSQRLANVVEGTGLGTWEWHLPSGEVLINELWASMLGASLESWGLPDGRVGLEHFNTLLHPDDVPKVFQAIERHLRGEADYEIEMRLRHADGHYVWVLARGKLLTRTSDGSPERMFGTHLDISERKATEQALARERQTLEQVITASNLGTWEWHVPSGRIQRNAQWARMIGYTLEELGDRAVDVDLETLAHPDDRAGVHLAIERHFSGEAPFLEMERRLRHKDGHWVWLLSRGRLLTRLPDGQPERVFGTITDISSQKAAEAQLATSRDLLDRTGRIAGIGGWVYDLRAETVHWTEQTAVIHDLPPGHQPAVEEAIGYFAPDAQLALVGAIAELREHGGQFDLELPMVTAKDRRIWVRLVAEAETEGGQPTRLVGAIQDISARREAQQMIRRSAELLRGAVDALEMPFALFDPQDLLVYCNEPFRTAFEGLEDLIRPGISYATMLREVLDHGSLLPEGADAEAWVLETVARRRRGPVTELAQYADGRVMRLIDRVMPDGHVVSFRIDLTEMVRAKQVAEEAALAKGQFLANMSHEIRTPLNAVLGMMALLGRTRLDTRQADYLGKAEGAARALLGILNDTLDFSKIEAGKMEIDPQPFQLDGLLRDLGVILAPAVKDKPVELLFDVAADVPRHLLGDAMRLQQVLVNLGGNALKFTASGEVVVRISRLAAEGDKVRLQFEVLDTGIGISPEQQSRLFTGFAQAEAGITRRFGGTGLGLVISQRLVALMGGQLSLSSELGRGSCFRFSLWLPKAAGKPSAASPLRALHLLVVDDHESTREVLGRQAQELGWQVSLAASGEQALQLLTEAEQRGEPVEAVLLDYRMPGIDGFETARRIRQTRSGQRSPLVVMITAHGRELLAEHEEQTALLDGFLVKPITASMMLDALATAQSSASHAAALPAPGTQRLLGLRLLLVEDNAINQQVATELLGAEGASIQLAGNGVEAISLLRQQPSDFDIVLMDLQMPEMDGLTATRLLRGELGLRQLPVVAMTANASAADRQACLDAGMNDHVGKPFDLDQLVAVLQAQAAPALREGRAAPALALPLPLQAGPAGEPAEVQHAAQAAGVQLATALARMGGLRDVYARMLEAFVAELPQHLAQLPVDNGETRARRLHTLKGVAATLGVDALARQLADAEPQAADAAHPKLQAVAAALQEAQPGLRRLLVAMRPAPRAAAPAKSGASPQALAAELQAALQDLQRCLLAHDAAALDLLPGLRPLLEPERYEPLAAAVESFAFAKAQQLVADWSAPS
jgi:PAS domain S-box-containing protein